MRFSLLVSLILIVYHIAVGQPQSISPNEGRQFVKILQQHHFEPRALDDRFSNDVFNHFLNSLDQERIYFTREEINALSVYRYMIDNELQGGGWRFLPEAAEIYRKSLGRAERTFRTILEKPIDVLKVNKTMADTSWVSSDNFPKKWERIICTEVMADLVKRRSLAGELSDSDLIKQFELLSRSQVKLNYAKLIQKMLNPPVGFEKHIGTLFLQAIAAVFDPHTVYFSPAQMENFIAALSTEGYYLGIDLKRNDRGEMLVSGLLPGGPAWKSGQIHSGDRIEKVRWEGKDWIDVHGMDEEEMSEILEALNHHTLEILIRKAGGIEKIVPLKKEKVSSDENIARAFLLDGRKKIGYISVPDFYSDWGDNEGGRSANDVAKEILKLKKENIDGVILDLRFNGGGAMHEAIAMAGIFIDAGPVGIHRERGNDLITLKDVNRGTVYDGPLVIMINGLSASASEFLAAALQDYKRAIIVGSPSYGKAVGQKIFSLENGKPVVDFQNLNTKKQWGFCTITTLRLYRITGKSIQGRGVTPDVIFPDLYDIYEMRESDLPFAMIPDSVSKKTYYQEFKPFPLMELRAKSERRVNDHDGFRVLRSFIQDVRDSSEDYVQPDWAMMKAMIGRRENSYSNLTKGLSHSSTTFRVLTHDFGKPRLQIDEYAQKVSDGWIANLSQDIALEESFNIICDYIDTLHIK